ncbi:hypothetical protein Tco_0741919 [Tanacetum coccineum]
MRINPAMKPEEPTYQVALDALALTTCYHAFLITAEVPVLGKEFDEPPTEKEALSFICELSHSGEIRHVNTQVYGAILPKVMTNQAILDSDAYKTNYAIASGAEPPKPRKVQKKESPSKTKPAKAKKVTATKPKPTMKKALVKADRGNGIDEGTGTKLGVHDVPKYDSESDKESWGNSDEDDEDNDNDSEDVSNEDDNDEDDDNDDGDDDMNDEDEETDSDRTELDRIMIPDPNQSITEHVNDEEEEESERVHTPHEFIPTNDDDKIDDEETMDEEDDDEVTKVLYEDVNEDAYVTLTAVHDKQKTDGTLESSSVSSDFTSKLLNLDNTPPHLDETSSQTSSLFIQEATPTPKPTTSEATTSTPTLLEFASVFKFNKRVTNLEKDLSEMKQVDQYAQALSLIHAIRTRDDKDKDQDPSVGSDRGTKRRKSSKEAELSRDLRSKEKKFSSTSKDTSHSQHKSSCKSAHTEEPSHTVEDSEVQHDQEFVMGDNDE